jgi:hypothetical protein
MKGQPSPPAVNRCSVLIGRLPVSRQRRNDNGLRCSRLVQCQGPPPRRLTGKCDLALAGSMDGCQRWRQRSIDARSWKSTTRHARRTPAVALRTYLLSQLLVAGAAMATIAVATGGGHPSGHHGGAYCGQYCDSYSGYDGGAGTARESSPIPASSPWVASVVPDFRALPAVSAAGDPTHQR